MSGEKQKDPVEIDVLDSVYFGRWVNKKIFSVLLFLVVILFVSLSVNAYYALFRPKPVYFASTSDGRIIPMVPLSKPVRSQRWLINWSGKVVLDLLTMSAVNYNKSFLRVRDKFLPQTFDSLVKTFDDNGTKKYILDNRMDTYVVLESSPIVYQSGIISGQRAWKIQVPVLVTYTNGNGSSPKRFLVNMIVMRVPTSVNKNGVAISNFSMIGAGTDSSSSSATMEKR